MALAPNKTKLVCTIGPASESPAMLRKMLLAGMDVARLNFSHGDFSWHKNIIADIRQAAQDVDRRVAIMADLPGPKIRIGQLAEEPILLEQGAAYTLTTNDILGDRHGCSVSFPSLPLVVKPEDRLSLNDGTIQLEVVGVAGSDLACRVLVGGELRSRKGLNLPGIDLGISAFTEHDRECMKFALENGVDALSQSFVETAADIEAVRQAAVKLGFKPFIIAKIERAGALSHIEGILDAADGIMVARGDLGVETPIERIAMEQKQLIEKANLLGKPVIIATQMLESMAEHYRPTRAEATDVANAILDGTDCVMLSEESAMGKYPVESVKMLAGIAAATEPYRRNKIFANKVGENRLVDLLSRLVEQSVDRIAPAMVIVPTTSGYTARMISRFKLSVWIVAVSMAEATCQRLQFSYGVHPVFVSEKPDEWNNFARTLVKKEGLSRDLAILTEGPSRLDPDRNLRLEIIEMQRRDHHETNTIQY